MKTTLEWLTGKITMLEECKDLKSRSQHINIKIIGVEETLTSAFCHWGHAAERSAQAE